MKMNKKDSVVVKLVIILFFFFLIFVNSGEKMINQGDIFVQHIVGNKSFMILSIGIVGLLFSIFSKLEKNLKIDIISVLLLIRFLLFVVSNLMISIEGSNNTDFQFGIVLAYFLCFCYYIIGSFFNNKELITKLCFWSIVIITFQLILTYIGRSLVYSNIVDMKWWMVIPLGQTNSIGCYLIGMMIYLNCSLNKKKTKIIVLILTLISILFTYSRSGLIIYALYILYIILLDLKKHKTSSIIKVFSIFVIVLCAMIILLLNATYIFDRFSFNSLSSSRIKVYIEGIELFSNNLLIGVGAYIYHIHDAYKAHNWILETFIQTGIIGSLLFFVIIKKVYIKIKKISPVMTIFMIFYLIHGLVEPNLYTVNFDSFFWLLIGSCVYTNQFDEKEKKNENCM